MHRESFTLKTIQSRQSCPTLAAAGSRRMPTARAEELSAMGDHKGAATWRRITAAVSQLATCRAASTELSKSGSRRMISLPDNREVY
jgi:hypothetical protein